MDRAPQNNYSNNTMAQLVKGLLHKHEDLGLDPQHPGKKPGEGHAPITPALKKKEIGSPEQADQLA